MKKIIPWGVILLIMGAVMIIGAVIEMANHNDKTPHTKICGTIVRMFDGEGITGGKHSKSYHDYYMDVHYDNDTYETVTVSTDTWYKYDENDRICFDSTDYRTPIPFILLAAFGVFILICGAGRRSIEITTKRNGY